LIVTRKCMHLIYQNKEFGNKSFKKKYIAW
jgi:hypothetical protein